MRDPLLHSAKPLDVILDWSSDLDPAGPFIGQLLPDYITKFRLDFFPISFEHGVNLLVPFLVICIEVEFRGQFRPLVERPLDTNTADPSPKA